jgi:AAA domain-containing protein
VKIAISGSGGIGKSTLAGVLAERRSLKLIDECLEPLFQEGSKEVSPARFAEVLISIQENKSQQEQGVDRLVTDRCGLDLMHIWMNNGLHLGTNLTDSFFAACRQQLHSYDYILIPPWGSFRVELLTDQEGSKQRNLNPLVQLRTHATIVGFAHMFVEKKRIIEIPQTINTLEERVQFIDSVIKRRSALPGSMV